MMLNTALAEVSACRIDGVIDAVFFMEIDPDKGRGLSDNDGWSK